MTRRIKLVALGDSLTAGFGINRRDAFPSRLERMLRERDRSVDVINEGISGDDTAGGLARLPTVLAHAPDVVIVALGANDGLRFYSADNTYNTLDTIITTLEDRGIVVLLAGIEVPLLTGHPYVQAFHAIFERLAKAHARVIFCPSLLAGVLGSAEHNLADRIHPNAAGARVIARSLLPYVERAIDVASGRDSEPIPA